MQTNHIHHLNYLVADMDKAVTFFSVLFGQQPHIEELTGRNVTTARYDLSGTFFILVQPLSDDGPVAKMLKDRGEGIFLLSFSVDDLSNAIDELKQQNIHVDKDSQRKGLEGWDICDLEAGDLQNIVLQLCQSNRTN